MRAIAAAVAVSAGSIVAGCAVSGPKPAAHYTTAPETTSSGVSLDSPRVEQIRLARASNRLFSIFPAEPGRKTCGIPEGGAHFKPLRGTCLTSIHSAKSHEPTLIVTFIERWDNGCPQTSDAGPCAPAMHRWQVIEAEPVVTTTARLRVVATRSSGATAPQYYK